jgi:hypothetical protein
VCSNGWCPRSATAPPHASPAVPTAEQSATLELILVPEGSRRVSKLDRLRRNPTDIGSNGLLKALKRLVDLRLPEPSLLRQALRRAATGIAPDEA